MATIFLLGPSFLQSGPKALLKVRRELAAIFDLAGHRAFLMEDEADKKGEDIVEKFYRLVSENAVSDIVVYWPLGAKMQTTYDEFILLRARMDVLKLPRIWVLHHSSVAMIRDGVFEVKEGGNRSRYLEAVARLGVLPLQWDTDEALKEQARLLAMEL
jgi:hypothetical protein